jgi:8-oxo-dGTP diphosphatase
MEPAEADAFAPNDEVDELRWLEPAQAAKILTYPRDAELALEIA